ncbi:MAG: proline iminopeptidase [Proteobacteria bacterium]|nr:MAG: proline iminopeptidase [Pseudomonadota bacterium]
MSNIFSLLSAGGQKLSLREPDEVRKVAVEGGSVVTYSYGKGDETLLLLQGGPGCPSMYVRDMHANAADLGYRVVFFDQLGTGASDKPDDPSLWTIERYAREVEAVRQALGLGKMQLWGHSWGAMLAIEYACTFPEGFKSLTLAHGIANVPFHQREADRLVANFGPEFVRMRRRHELKRDFSHPEYQASELIMLYRHACRLRHWPAAVVEDLKYINVQIRDAMLGQEYYVYGNLRHWNRIPDMHKITQPCLIMTGEHDALTPNESEEMLSVMPNARLHLFDNASHFPAYECRDEYYPVMEKFWAENRG